MHKLNLYQRKRKVFANKEHKASEEAKLILFVLILANSCSGAAQHRTVLSSFVATNKQIDEAESIIL